MTHAQVASPHLQSTPADTVTPHLHLSCDILPCPQHQQQPTRGNVIGQPATAQRDVIGPTSDPSTCPMSASQLGEVDIHERATPPSDDVSSMHPASTHPSTGRISGHRDAAFPAQADVRPQPPVMQPTTTQPPESRITSQLAATHPVTTTHLPQKSRTHFSGDPSCMHDARGPSLYPEIGAGDAHTIYNAQKTCKKHDSQDSDTSMRPTVETSDQDRLNTGSDIGAERDSRTSESTDLQKSGSSKIPGASHKSTEVPRAPQKSLASPSRSRGKGFSCPSYESDRLSFDPDISDRLLPHVAPFVQDSDSSFEKVKMKHVKALQREKKAKPVDTKSEPSLNQPEPAQTRSEPSVNQPKPVRSGNKVPESSKSDTKLKEQEKRRTGKKEEYKRTLHSSPKYGLKDTIGQVSSASYHGDNVWIR